MNTAISQVVSESVTPSSRPRVLAIEVEVQGHHADYVLLYAKSFLAAGVDARFLVTPKFFRLHADVVEQVAELDPDRISIVSLTEEESAKMEKNSWLRYFHAWPLFCKYCREYQADHGLVMYFDFYQLPMMVGEHSPCPVSAIYFRPTFHYHKLANYKQTWKEWFRAKRKEVLLRRVVKHPKMATLLCLDEIAADYVRENFSPNCKVQHLADSFEDCARDIEHESGIINDLGIEPGRRIFCLQGVLDQRKGIRELLECLTHIPEDAAKKICILLLGKLNDGHRDEIRELVDSLQSKLSVQIILKDEWITGSVQHYYRLSDIILATYQGHMGSSSALIRAALAGKPVLSSDYGLMGAITEKHKLGAIVDTGDSRAMAASLARLATCDLDEVMDKQEASRYAKQHSTEQLVDDLSELVG